MTMCAKPGVVAASNDPKGDRMLCEIEEPVGTHLARCVCQDEQGIVAAREETQQQIREMELPKCVPAPGGGKCANVQ
jgi:hypothetical protein